MIYFKKYVSLKVFDLNFFQNHFELTCILIRRAWDAQNITKSSFVILILLVASQYPDKTVYRRNKSVRCNTLFGKLYFKLIVDVLKNVWVDNSIFHSQKDLPNVKKYAWCIIFKHICRSLYLKTQREPYKIGKTKPDFVKSRIRRIAEAIQIANTINRFSYFFFFFNLERCRKPIGYTWRCFWFELRFRNSRFPWQRSLFERLRPWSNTT